MAGRQRVQVTCTCFAAWKGGVPSRVGRASHAGGSSEQAERVLSGAGHGAELAGRKTGPWGRRAGRWLCSGAAEGWTGPVTSSRRGQHRWLRGAGLAVVITVLGPCRDSNVVVHTPTLERDAWRTQASVTDRRLPAGDARHTDTLPRAPHQRAPAEPATGPPTPTVQ